MMMMMMHSWWEGDCSSRHGALESCSDGSHGDVSQAPVHVAAGDPATAVPAADIREAEPGGDLWKLACSVPESLHLRSSSHKHTRFYQSCRLSAAMSQQRRTLLCERRLTQQNVT